MGTEDQRVVWILGAGFSVPLGGPLFRELISPSTLKTLGVWQDYAKQTWFGHVPANDGSESASGFHHPALTTAEIVCWVYTQGLGTASNPMKLWADAEQFLERLEIATGEPSSQLARDIQEKLNELKGSPVAPEREHAVAAFLAQGGLTFLHHEAIRFVAGACSTFLLRAEQNPRVIDESEQWDPYRRWVELLRPGYDTIITFNYDRTLDILGEYCRRHLNSSPLVSPVGMTANKFKTLCKTSVPVFHLHGHVGWLLSDDRESIVVSPSNGGLLENPAVAHKAPEKAVIGLPGQHKLSLPSGLLKPTWDGAMAAISDADAIAFCGYRFPETDNMAKRRLIEALKAKPSAKTHVVLGTNNPDRPRLEGMINWTRMGYGNPPRVHELWAQDFFAVFERKHL